MFLQALASRGAWRVVGAGQIWTVLRGCYLVLLLDIPAAVLVKLVVSKAAQLAVHEAKKLPDLLHASQHTVRPSVVAKLALQIHPPVHAAQPAVAEPAETVATVPLWVKHLPRWHLRRLQNVHVQSGMDLSAQLSLLLPLLLRPLLGLLLCHLGLRGPLLAHERSQLAQLLNQLPAMLGGRAPPQARSIASLARGRAAGPLRSPRAVTAGWLFRIHAGSELPAAAALCQTGRRHKPQLQQRLLS
mmetsp:Transcript_77439/g.219136  ORF Transcript_77439/g.219136 Transcript_77439/m.219136 type:complete len:244 (-) Transcript_77439:614-1345(-)